MGAVQEIKYKSNNKDYIRFQWVVPKAMVSNCNLQKGDHLIFNGEMGGIITLKLKRKGEIENAKQERNN